MSITGNQNIECSAAQKTLIAVLQFNSHQIAPCHLLQVFDVISRQCIKGHIFSRQKRLILIIDELEFIFQPICVKFRNIIFPQYFFHNTDRCALSTFRISTQNGQGLRNIVLQNALSDKLLEGMETILDRKHIIKKLLKEKRALSILIVNDINAVMAVKIGRKILQDKIPFCFIEYQNTIADMNKQLLARLNLIDIHLTFQQPYQSLCLGCIVCKADPLDPFLRTCIKHKIQHLDYKFRFINTVPKSCQLIIFFKDLPIADIPVFIFQSKEFNQNTFIKSGLYSRPLKRRSFNL